jgi:hypothetical protein
MIRKIDLNKSDTIGWQSLDHLYKEYILINYILRYKIGGGEGEGKKTEFEEKLILYNCIGNMYY